MVLCGRSTGRIQQSKSSSSVPAATSKLTVKLWLQATRAGRSVSLFVRAELLYGESHARSRLSFRLRKISSWHTADGMLLRDYGSTDSTSPAAINRIRTTLIVHQCLQYHTSLSRFNSSALQPDHGRRLNRPLRQSGSRSTSNPTPVMLLRRLHYRSPRLNRGRGRRQDSNGCPDDQITSQELRRRRC